MRDKISRTVAALLATLVFIVIPVIFAENALAINFFSPTALWINRVGYCIFFATMLIFISIKAGRFTLVYFIAAVAIIALLVLGAYSSALDFMYVLGWFITMFTAAYLDRREKKAVQSGEDLH
jgi:hypothetical protein